MNQKINKFLTILSFFSATLAISSCYEHEDGCRDINATNFSVKVDIDCENECCTYPEVQIQMQLVMNSEIIDTSRFFPLDDGDSIRIKMLRIFFSDFKFTNEDGKIYPVCQDVLLGKRSTNSIDYSNKNYTALKFKPETSSYTIGESKNLIKANKLSFIFGLDSEINHSVIDKVGTSSPLYKSQDSIYINESEGFYFLKISLVSKKNSDLVKTLLISNESNIKSFVFNGDFNLTSRNRHTIKLNIETENLFKGIKFDHFGSNSAGLIIENLSKSVFLKTD
jgi:hypothetical protein